MKKIFSNFIFNLRWLWLSALLVGAGFGFAVVNQISTSSQPVETATILVCLGLLAVLVLIDFVDSGGKILERKKSFKVHKASDLIDLSESDQRKYILAVDERGKNQSTILFVPTPKQTTSATGLPKTRKQGGVH